MDFYLQAGNGWWFVDLGCRRKRPPPRSYGATGCRRYRSATAVQDALRANQGPRVYAKVEDRPRHKVSAARPNTVASACAKLLRRDGARQCPPPKGEFGSVKKPMVRGLSQTGSTGHQIKPNHTGSDRAKCDGGRVASDRVRGGQRTARQRAGMALATSWKSMVMRLYEALLDQKVLG